MLAGLVPVVCHWVDPAAKSTQTLTDSWKKVLRRARSHTESKYLNSDRIVNRREPHSQRLWWYWAVSATREPIECPLNEFRGEIRMSDLSGVVEGIIKELVRLKGVPFSRRSNDDFFPFTRMINAGDGGSLFISAKIDKDIARVARALMDDDATLKRKFT